MNARDLTLPPFDELPIPDDATAFPAEDAEVVSELDEDAEAPDAHALPTRSFAAVTGAVLQVVQEPDVHALPTRAVALVTGAVVAKAPRASTVGPADSSAAVVSSPAHPVSSVMSSAPRREPAPTPPPIPRAAEQRGAEPKPAAPPSAAPLVPPPAVPARTLAPPAPAAAVAKNGLPPLPFPVQTALPEKPKRTLPKSARIALVVGGGLLLLIVIGNLRSKSGPPPQLRLETSVAVNEEDLRKRRDVTPTDLTQRGRPMRPTPPATLPRTFDAPTPPVASAAPAEGELSPEELDARRRLRTQDPADLRGLKRDAAAPVGAPAVGTRRERDLAAARKPRQLYMNLDGKPSASEELGTPTTGGGKDAVLVPAGASLNAVLDTPIQITGSRGVSIVAIISDGPHRGGRLLGVASYAGGRVSIRFNSFITLKGEELDVRAEARGEDGGFGVPVDVPEDSSDGEPSAESEVARDTGTDLVAGALGGIGGQVVRDYSSKKSRRSYGRKETVVNVAKGEPVTVFVQSAVVLRYAR